MAEVSRAQERGRAETGTEMGVIEAPRAGFGVQGGLTRYGVEGEGWVTQPEPLGEGMCQVSLWGLHRQAHGRRLVWPCNQEAKAPSP